MLLGVSNHLPDFTGDQRISSTFIIVFYLFLSLYVSFTVHVLCTFKTLVSISNIYAA